MRSFIRKPQIDHHTSSILRSLLYVCAVMVLFGVLSAFLLTAETRPDRQPAKSAQKPAPGLPEEAVMQQLLSQYEGMAVQELFDARYEKRDYVDELSFDPTQSKYFDRIRDKMKLTGEELEIYRRHGFVSIDHRQRHSFGSAYYQIYSADLPVFITTDSILNALHRSFDSLLADLERSVLSPTLAEILEDCHETLATTPVPSQLERNRRDVDLYLTVARNLLTATGRNPQEMLKHPLSVPPQFEQNAEVQTVLELIYAEQIQVPGTSSPTTIYGGSRFVDYSQFRPRSHYAADARLSAYFRCMMWLGRADCGWFVLPTDPHDGVENDADRELRNAALLALVLEESGRRENYESMARLLTAFVGGSDNLTVPSLITMMKRRGITSAADLAEPDRFNALAIDIEQGGGAAQRIRSQSLVSPDGVPDTTPPPALVQMFGQSFVIDAFVLSNVVFDSIFYNGEKVRRMMPMGLDVMAALGNDEALSLLEPELEKWHYSGNLMAASEFIDRCEPEFWESRLYNVWLDALRELDDQIEQDKHVPEIMRTRVWQKKQLQTQLASWSELRHDTILIAKQSFTGVPSCEYPAGYVEPYPEFYRKIKQFASNARRNLTSLYRDQQQLESRRYYQTTYEKHLGFFGGMIDVLGNLETIARKELDAQPLTPEEELFLEQTIDRRGNVSFGSGSRPRYDGWFCDLLYKRKDVLEWSPTITDVHTYPNRLGESQALQVGIGDVNFGIIAVNCKDNSTAYVGPVYSYYEFSHPANDRLTDDAWQRRIISGDLPERPGWTRDFQGRPDKRTVDGLSITMKNEKIRLIQTRENQLPEIREFPDTDEGIARLVDHVISRKRTDRLSLNFSGARFSDKALDHLVELPGLAFVALPYTRLSPEAIDRFRAARPDVQVRPEKLHLIRAVLCESVGGYAEYEPVSAATFEPGDEFLIYAELGAVKATSNFGTYTHILQMSYQIIDAKEEVVARHDYPEDKHIRDGLPRRFHLAHKVKLADELTAGTYRLRIQISDNSQRGNVRLARSLGKESTGQPVPTVETTIDFTVSKP